MHKYPDQIVILKVNGNGPYETPTRTQVYAGRCRAFLDRESRFRTETATSSSYQVVIPDRKMPDVGENFVVAVRFHNNPNARYWDVVGYVKDFARYERVCKVIFEVVKQNAIYEDIPGPALEQGTNRKLGIFENSFVHIESPGLIGDDTVVAGEPILIYPKNPNSTIELKWLGYGTLEDPEPTYHDIIEDTGENICTAHTEWTKNDVDPHFVVVLNTNRFENYEGGPFEPILHIVTTNPNQYKDEILLNVVNNR